MTGPELQRNLQALSTSTYSEIDGAFRRLREADLMPTTGHGYTGVPMTPRHAALALLALCVNVPGALKAKAAQDWFAAPAADPGAATGSTLGSALESALVDTVGTFGIREVRICRDWPFAQITTSQAVHKFGATTADQARALGYRAAPIRSEFVLTGGALHQLAIDLSGANDGAAEIIA